MNQATDSQTIEQTLNKTDLGHIVYEYRKLIIGALVVILVGAVSYGVWKQTSESKALTQSENVFEFQSKTWADAQSGKIEPAALVKAFESLGTDTQNAPVMLPVVLEMSKFLYEKNLVAEADSILSKVTPKDAISQFFLATQRAVVLEKLGKIDEAIAVLEKIAQGKDGLMPAKVSVELGRLYMAKGEKGKAQMQFDYVISNYPNDEHAKLAKLYLSQLAQ